MMKRCLTLLLALVLVFALGMPAFAASGIETFTIEDLFSPPAKQVSTNLSDAIDGKVFYADTTDTFAIQMPSFMRDPLSMADDGMIILYDVASQSLLFAMYVPVDELADDYEEYETFEEFAEQLHLELLEVFAEMDWFGIDYKVSEVELVEMDGMVNSMLITIDAELDDFQMIFPVVVSELENGDYFLCMGGYTLITDVELAELVALSSTLILY